MSRLPRFSARRTTVVAFLAAVLALLCAASLPVRAATVGVIPSTINPLAVGSPVNRVVWALCPGGNISGETHSGTLPAGLTFSTSTGAPTISGTPTSTAAYSWTINFTCNNGDTGSITYSGTVAPAGTSIPVSVMLPDGIAFSQNVGDTESGFTVGGSGGTPPYLMTVAGGTPPPGINFSTSGVITGTYTTAGVFAFILKATDSLGASGTSTITITVLAAITISPSALPTIRVGVPFSQQLTASGGTGTGYTWTPTTGTQIPGLSISPSGLLAGTPTTAGPYNRGFRVTDSGGNQGNIVYTGTVQPAAVPTMPQWMLIAFALLLVGIAVRRLSMRRMARP